jgi:hypothetical protein
MFGSKSYPATFPSPIAVNLRVASVRRAAEFYQTIGFTFVMAVPDDSDEWLLCLLRYGTGSILLGAIDDPKFPRTGSLWRLQRRIALNVPDVATTTPRVWLPGVTSRRSRRGRFGAIAALPASIRSATSGTSRRPRSA